jgi:hypothetical protein
MNAETRKTPAVVEISDISSDIITCGTSSQDLFASPQQSFDSTESCTPDKDLKFMVKTMLSEAKVRDIEMKERMSRMEKNVKFLVKSTKRSRSSGDAEAGADEEVDLEDFTSDDEPDQDRSFCVALPCQSFEEFQKLEAELETRPDKRKDMVSSYRKLGS